MYSTQLDSSVTHLSCTESQRVLSQEGQPQAAASFLYKKYKFKNSDVNYRGRAAGETAGILYSMNNGATENNLTGCQNMSFGIHLKFVYCWRYTSSFSFISTLTEQLRKRNSRQFELLENMKSVNTELQTETNKLWRSETALQGFCTFQQVQLFKLTRTWPEITAHLLHPPTVIRLQHLYSTIHFSSVSFISKPISTTGRKKQSSEEKPLRVITY